MDHLAQIVLLLAVSVLVMVTFQRLHIPSSLGYLLVGLILGPHTAGPTVYVAEFKILAEFGVVFLLFSIGLNYSLPQLHAMRHQILGLGTAQVVLTTALVTGLLWLAGLDAAVAFVIGWPSSSVRCLRSRRPPSSAGSWPNRVRRRPRMAGSVWPFRSSRTSPPCPS